MMRFDSALGLESRRGPFATAGKILLYSGMVVVFTGPLLGLLISAFNKTLDPTSFTWWPDEFTFDNFVHAADRNVYLYLFNSFVVVGFGLLLQMIVSVFAAYSLARKKFRGMGVVMLIMLATMMMPEEIIAIPLSLVLADMPLLNVNLIGTYAGMILPVGAWGFSILVMTEFMKEVPVELEEAARIDGAGELRTFFTVILPLSPARARRDRRLRLHHDLGPVPAAAHRGARVEHVDAAHRAALAPLRRGGGHRRAAGGHAAGAAAVDHRVPRLPAAVHARSDEWGGEGVTCVHVSGRHPIS
ncbi:carbohydrate ABC transporter permease [Nonomuraea ferruginea]